jgi:uncharacterized glyoxalase superfamily protein PhnB
MKAPPAGWPRLSTSLFYDDAGKAIDWLCRAFGFEVQLKIEGGDGSIVHSQLVFGEALVMVGAATSLGEDGKPHRPWRRSPNAIGGANTQAIMIFVDDVDAHCARARAEGATIAAEPKTTDYGDDYWTDRGYEAVDVEGHHWWFVQRIADGKSAKR